MTPIVELTSELCRRPSVTPDDAGCQSVIAARLARAGFMTEPLPFGDVHNVWIHHGGGDPVLVLLGHTDVVPPGPLAEWASPPFEPSLRDGHLHARGAADMKGSIAAMTVALERFVAGHPRHRGTLALLLTSDEEGPSRDGIRRVAETFQRRGQRIDWCLVGEPSSKTHLGDVVRIGRRGSLSGRFVVRGVQGHVAFPDLALNPIHAVAPALAELSARRWDHGNAHFPPTGMQIVNVAAGTGALNVIPGELSFDLNFRFGTASTAEDLMRDVEAVLVKHGLDYRVHWELSGAPFVTVGGELLDAVRHAVRAETGIEPRADTGGGTSDGRFIAPLGAQVVELGPVNATIHKIDERVAVADLETLGRVYYGVIARLLG
jgi:succinyl-diaminopimelate desuccinylase